ncbi:class I SAM-dependent methyltransferase [Aldersonia sp. NBC_00410]|uniref:class I SAM-dependent methyltransferase n=1 Tax=Aldersonia sp. NBC_00410 TaxID=2975954 RepID=UPI0022589763|nr:class I SAM-dependent methyltransferase [Aldersonia sp. NBC_00410]MCX5044437.1 class I SAM-dependent methyltransferase [Aldersonia sp. NBC_00410]
MGTRWDASAAPRGDDYDERWVRLAAAGRSIHGEADLVELLLREIDGSRVLDAGCGTGRVAIELHRRGIAATGVDADQGMLSNAERNGPGIRWIHADLVDLSTHVDDVFDLAVLAGNVMIFVEPGTERTVLEQVVARVAPGGLLVAGFALKPDRIQLADYDRYVAEAGVEFISRWATWGREPFDGGDYAVSVHRKPTAPPTQGDV